MKEAIAIQVGTRRIPTTKASLRSLHELSKRFEYPIIHGFMPDHIAVPDLQKAVDFLNHPEVGMDDYQFKTKEEWEATGIEPAITPVSEDHEEESEDKQEARGEFAHLNDSDRATLLRQMIRRRLQENTPSLPDCQDYEIRLGKILQYWGTGLSRQTITRHIKTVVEEMGREGLQVTSTAGKYRMLR